MKSYFLSPYFPIIRSFLISISWYNEIVFPEKGVGIVSGEDKFSNLSLKDKTIIIGVVILILIIFFAFIFFVYVGIFQITGIEYSSRTALLLFFHLSFY